MTVLSSAQVAGLVRNAGFPASVQPTMVAIVRAESGNNIGAKNPHSSALGLLQILWSAHKQYDYNKLLTDAQYNINAGHDIYKSQGLTAWVSYTNGDYKKYLNEARSAVASASSVTGSSVTSTDSSSANGTGQPAITYGPPGPQYTSAGIGTPLTSAAETDSPLSGLRILGSELGGDYSTVVIGAPAYSAAMETIPNLSFSISDPDGKLLWSQSNVWVRGSHVSYQDLSLRIDTIAFVPGDVGTGALNITCVDDIVYRLQQLTGPRTVSGQSASQWMAEEMRIAGIDPDKYLLAEAVPTQSQISRDVPDQSGTESSGAAPSAWTTIVRLASELGKRVFISGRRLVFGSSAFAMQWTAPGPVRLSWDELDWSERFLTLPSVTHESVSSNSNVVECKGKIPLSRAKYFRPGVPVIVRNVPALAAASWVSLMCFDVAFTLGTDTDGADITLVAPVNPPPQPPTSGTSAGTNAGSTSNGSSTSGGGVDGQMAQFVALALKQAGKRYVYGAYASPTNPNPTAFDCCLTIDSMISTRTRGPIPIAEVQAGDQVWCWDGGKLTENTVRAVATQPVQPVFSVKTRNSTVRASANHPFLVMRRERKRSDAGRWLPVEWTPEWVRLDNLTTDDLVVSLEKTPIPYLPVSLSDCTEITEDVAWLIGQIIGDGHIHNSGINIAAFRSELRERISDIVRKTWNVRSVFHPTHGVILSSVHLRDIFSDLGMRVPGPDKRIPDALRLLPEKQLRALLGGYADADGHRDKRGHQSYSSASRRLINDVRALHRTLGDRVSNVSVTQRKKVITIKGKVIKNALPLHSFAVYPDSIRRNTTVLNIYGARRALPDLAFTVERIVSIIPEGEEPTFDLQIDNAHNYIADGLVVHNSELVQWCCERVGITGCPRTSTEQRAWCSEHHTTLSVATAIKTKGALLFANGHVAISLGNGRTIEAMNPADGVRQGNANGNRGWIGAGRIPGAKGYL
jgi:hypothetical protein